MNKQIEDLGKKLRAYAYDMKLNDNDDCQNVADFIITTLGYRKTEDIAMEIFDGVMQAIEEGTKNATSTLKQSVTTHEKLLVSTGEMYSGFVGKAICQFFKKYESEGADDDL